MAKALAQVVACYLCAMAGEEELIQRVLDSRAFAHAPRLRRLLACLANPEDSSGIRTPDAETDRLEARLSAYYLHEGASETRRIRLEGARLVWEQREGVVAEPARLAVLPVSARTPEYSFLADGLTGDLITALSEAGGLRVIGRNSVQQFRDRGRDLRQISAQLSVEFLVESALQVQEGRVQMQFHIVEAPIGRILWNEEFDRPLGCLIRMRDELIGAITDSLRLEVDAGRYALGTGNVNAYLDCLRGRQALAFRTPESLKVCSQYFRSAIDQDEAYADPHAGLAECQLVEAVNDLASAHEAMPLARSAARRALELNDRNAEARAILAAISAVYEWNWAESAAGMQDAIRTKPGVSQLYQLNAIARLVPQGRWEEALEAMDFARKLDPAAAVLARDLGLIHFLRRDWEQALVELRRVRDIPGAEYWLGRLFIELRRFQEALDVLEPPALVSHRALSAVAYCYARMGRRAQAEQVMRQIRDVSRKSRVTALDFAHPLIGLARYDEAFAYLRQALTERATGLMYLQVDPIYDALRKDARYMALLSQLGLAG